MNRTSSIAVIFSLAVLAAEYVFVFNAQANPVLALGHLALAMINGVIIAFAVLLLIIGLLLAHN